eukprot:15457404-Alexandrium_andersonii.AAC.1
MQHNINHHALDGTNKHTSTLARLQQPLDQAHVGRMTLTPSRGHAVRIGVAKHALPQVPVPHQPPRTLVPFPHHHPKPLDRIEIVARNASGYGGIGSKQEGMDLRPGGGRTDGLDRRMHADASGTLALEVEVMCTLLHDVLSLLNTREPHPQTGPGDLGP